MSSKIVGVNLICDPLFQIKNVLSEFPEIIDVARATVSEKHQIQCHIDTTGASVNTSPRRLTPEKCETERKYFNLMFAAGICHRSSSL